MLSADKTFSSFDSPQKPFRFVSVNSVLDVFAMGKQFKIVQPVIGAVEVLMVNLHTRRNRADKRFPHSAMNGNLSVFSMFAWAKPNVMVARYVRLNWTRPTISRPRLAVLNVKRGCDASIKKTGHAAQRSTISKHGFSGVDLFGIKKFSSRYAANARKIADFVQAFIAADRFPNFHSIDIKPVYVGSQQ